MGPHRTPAPGARDAGDRRLTLDDPWLPLLVVLACAPIVIAALARGATWGVGESLAAAALVLAIAKAAARVSRR